MSKKVQMLYIQPGKRPELIDTDQDLETLQELVGGNIECVYPWLDQNVAVICNEDGKFNEYCKPNRALKYKDCDPETDTPEKIYDIVFGSFMIAACGQDGDFKSLSDKEVDFFMKRFYSPELFFKDSSEIVAVPYEPEDRDR